MIKSFFKRFYVLIFRQKGREGEREGEMCLSHIDWPPYAHPQPGYWPATQAFALTGNQTGDLLVHRPVLNPLSHISQGSNKF